jgi:LCP family protein required for cell wall assembly
MSPRNQPPPRQQPPGRDQPQRSQPPSVPARRGSAIPSGRTGPPPRDEVERPRTSVLRQPDRDAERPKPRPERDDLQPPRRSPNWQRAILGGRVAMALVAVLVFCATAYGWTKVNDLSNGLSTEDVIDPNAQGPLGEQNILLVGLDTRTDAQGNPLPPDVLNQLHAGGGADGGDTTDTMIVIHIPAGGGQAVAISIPRDSFVSIAGGYGMHKINSAYTYGKQAALKQLQAQGKTGADLDNGANAGGAKIAIQTVEQFTGLSINHYAAVNLAGFYFISQAVGGVEVCLKNAVKDSYSGADFPAGTQFLSGSQALEFVRQRHGLPNSDLDRIKRQQAFMGSMAKTVLSGGMLTNPSKLNALIAAVKKAVVLDSGWDVLGFAQQMAGMTAGAMHFGTIPIVSITYHTATDGDAVEVSPSQVQAFVQQQLNGAPPGSPAAATTAPAAGSGAGSGSSANASTTVDVYNGNGQGGLAGAVTKVLVEQGYTQGDSGNGASRSRTVVEYGSGEKSAAQSIASALGGGITVAASSAVSSGHVAVYLGKDYTGPGSGGSSSPQLFTPAATSSQPDVNADGIPCIN